IRRDLLAFVSENDKISDIANGFEYVWGRMVEMPSRDFLDLFKAILIDEYKSRPLNVSVRTTGDEFEVISGNSRQIIDQIIDLIAEEFADYERQSFEYDEEESGESW